LKSIHCVFSGSHLADRGGADLLCLFGSSVHRVHGAGVFADLLRWENDADFSVSYIRPPNKRIEVTENLGSSRLQIHPQQQALEPRVVAELRETKNPQ